MAHSVAYYVAHSLAHSVSLLDPLCVSLWPLVLLTLLENKKNHSVLHSVAFCGTLWYSVGLCANYTHPKYTSFIGLDMMNKHRLVTFPGRRLGIFLCSLILIMKLDYSFGANTLQTRMALS